MYAGVTYHYKYPFLYLLIALCAGIISNDYLSLPVYCLFLLLTAGICCNLIKSCRHYTDYFLLLTLFCCGQAISPIPPSFNPEQKSTYDLHACCEEELTGHNYILSAGKQRFYLSGFDTDTVYQPGDSLHFKCRIVPLSDLSNPGEFSYANYLKQKEVYFRLLPTTEIEQHSRSGDLRFFFEDTRQKLLDKTARLIKDSVCRHVVNALCLGFKNDLDSELQDLFISTGTVHLLSVSGLHTGAIYLLLVYIFGLSGFSRRTKELIVIPFLWSYACLTGLSPSTVRAATILTFITIGKTFYRSYTPLNAVAASAFLTLLICPADLHSLSFLMSYSAYTGILLLYPLFFHLPGKLPNYVSKIYACCCITIAAQIPTLPINAFYFHTININGFLANIIAVPVATLILYGSAICLLLPVSIGQYLIPGIEFLNKILISGLECLRPAMLNLQNLYPTALTILLAYMLLLFTYAYISQRKAGWLQGMCCTLGILIVYLSLQNFDLASRQEILISHHYRQTAIVLNYRGYYAILQATDTTLKKVQPYLHKNKLKPLPPDSEMLDSFLQWQNHLLYTPTDTVVIASNSRIQFPGKYTLIVTKNFGPEKLCGPDSLFYPSLIIADGSNSVFTIRKWELFCQKHQIRFYNTNEKGAFVLKLK